VNVHETDERYEPGEEFILPKLAGIAKRFHADWPQQVGLIGITEPTRRIRECAFVPPPATITLPDIDLPDSPFGGDLSISLPDQIQLTHTATRCLAGAMSHFFGQHVGHYHNNNEDESALGNLGTLVGMGGSSAKDLGIVYGQDWEKLDTHSWQMGIQWTGDVYVGAGGVGANIDLVSDANINWTWARKLQMVLFRHRPTRLRLRFYCAHFSPGQKAKDKGKRRAQAARLIKKVLDRASADDDFPPVVVGDFNAQRTYGEHAEDSIDILEKYFRRPLDDVAAQHGLTKTGIDTVWIGKREHFPEIAHDFMTLSLRRVEMIRLAEDQYGQKYTELADDGFPKSPLTDHKFAEGFQLRATTV
jgi:hypothetical protein